MIQTEGGVPYKQREGEEGRYISLYLKKIYFIHKF